MERPWRWSLLRDARHTLFSYDASNCRYTGKAAEPFLLGTNGRVFKLAKSPSLASILRHAPLIVLVLVQRQLSFRTNDYRMVEKYA